MIEATSEERIPKEIRYTFTGDSDVIEKYFSVS